MYCLFPCTVQQQPTHVIPSSARTLQFSVLPDLVIPKVSRLRDTSICHLGGFFWEKLQVVIFLFGTYYYIILGFLSSLSNKKSKNCEKSL